MKPGLTSHQAAHRLAVLGPNRFVQVGRWERARAIAEVVADPMALMLAFVGIVNLVLGERVDGTILLLALIPVLGVDVVLGARSRRALAALRDTVAPRASVIRDGTEQTIPTEAVVVGDLLVIHEGDMVHADARVERDTVAVDEAPLTGESEPQHRGIGETIFAGSRVVGGRANAVVTATGRRTAFGAIAALVAATEAGTSPLQRSVGQLVKRLGILAIVLAGALFGLRMAAGAAPIAALIAAISLAMAAIPEEFPLVLTMFLSLGALRLARRGVLVRRLAAVESLGATTVICTDKTGTLTRGAFDLAARRVLDGDDLRLLAGAVLACELAPDDIMERAIVADAVAQGVDVAGLHATWSLVTDHPFEIDGKHMTHVWQAGDRYQVVMKGALEGVLEHCAITATARAIAEREMVELGRAGMRVLGVAVRAGIGSPPSDRAEAEHALTLLGLLGFRDPLRPEVPSAIAACREAGIHVKVVTGDHAITARAIAELAGLAIEPDGVVTGPELAALSPDARARRIVRATVLARIRPEQKHEIVDTLVEAGEVVAMTGDGINDAPALRRASIGVSMGAGATEVARAAAGLVLLDNDFGALVATVREGRRIHANLQRAFLFLVAFHVPIISLAIAAPLLGLPLLLPPILLVWLELVVHPVAALVFEAEPEAVDAMRRPPRSPTAPLLPRRLLVRSVISGSLVALGALALFAMRLSAGVDLARGAAITTLIAGGIALTFAERALDLPWRAVPVPRSRRFWIVITVVAATIPITMLVPGLARLMQIAPIEGRDVLFAIAIAIVAVGWRALGIRP